MLRMQKGGFSIAALMFFSDFIFSTFPLPCLQIHYWEMDNQNETEKVKILFLPETSVRLKNLTSYTYYMVKLSAFNAAGDGPLSEPRRGRTLQSGQIRPHIASLHLTVLLLTWSTIHQAILNWLNHKNVMFSSQTTKISLVLFFQNNVMHIKSCSP